MSCKDIIEDINKEYCKSCDTYYIKHCDCPPYGIGTLQYLGKQLYTPEYIKGLLDLKFPYSFF